MVEKENEKKETKRKIVSSQKYNNGHTIKLILASVAAEIMNIK